MRAVSALQGNSHQWSFTKAGINSVKGSLLHDKSNSPLIGIQLLTTYCFIRAGEVWAIQLIYSHNDSNQIFAIQDGCRKDVFCSVVGELINKWAELGTLFYREFTNKHLHNMS